MFFNLRSIKFCLKQLSYFTVTIKNVIRGHKFLCNRSLHGTATHSGGSLIVKLFLGRFHDLLVFVVIWIKYFS